MTSFTMGHVVLTVHDKIKTGQWYANAVGLHLLRQDGTSAYYGAGDQTLLELREDKAARQRGPREAGLFHTAFLLPNRANLGSWMLNAIDKKITVEGASDHDVSEAFYLSDPEGNGVEIYADRPRTQWQTSGNQVKMGSTALNLHDVAGAAHGQKPWQGVPEGTTIGHVHLQVGTIPEAKDFYQNVLGLDLTTQMPSAAFFAADGYHHHIAANVWNSAGAGVRPQPSTGLSEMNIHLSAARAKEISAKLGHSDLQFNDPWGTPIALNIL